MKYFKEFKCPNGNPPHLCWHVPQLVMNLFDYSTQKSEMRKERAEQKSRDFDASTSGQKQRRRGQCL